MNIDVIVAWPRNCDYPLFRKFIKEERKRFEKVIIVFTETYQGNDYRSFARQDLEEDNITFLQNPVITGKQDWRNVAVNMALEVSTADWVWFTEQDFFTTDEFWKDVKELMKYQSAFGVYEGYRLHPCCIFAKRDYIEGTSKNFGIVKDELDHFGVFQKEIKALTDVVALDEKTYHHMAGLSHNMRLLAEGEMLYHNMDDFTNYIKKCMKEMLLMPPDYRIMFKEFLDKYNP